MENRPTTWEEVKLEIRYYEGWLKGWYARYGEPRNNSPAEIAYLILEDLRKIHSCSMCGGSGKDECECGCGNTIKCNICNGCGLKPTEKENNGKTT
jgi:hypothetical protein